MRILVVEDEELIRMLVVETLIEDGFDVLEAASGVEGCELVKNPDHVDLVVTDLHMPRTSGIEVARCARSQHEDIPILFISARPDLLVEMSPPQPYTFLRKPFGVDELSNAVEQLAREANLPR